MITYQDKLNVARARYANLIGSILTRASELQDNLHERTPLQDDEDDQIDTASMYLSDAMSRLNAAMRHMQVGQ
jgi:hypothetical protein